MRLRPAQTLLGAALSLAIGGTASAALVRSAEHGSVPLVSDAPQGLDAGVVVRPGEVAWRETMRPALNVRLTSAADARSIPGKTAGVPAGTVLFGYKLQGGVAYCPVVHYRAPVPKVQCFRDLDGDDRFDGGYVSNMDGMRSQVIAGYVQRLVAIPKVSYEPVTVAEATPIGAAFIYKGVKGGRHVFLPRIEDENLDDTMACEPVSAAACEIFGLKLEITPQDAGVRIVLLSVRSPRGFQVDVHGLL